MNITAKEKFIALLNDDVLNKADAIVLLEGDGYNRISTAVDLYKNKWARKILVSGGVDNADYGSFPAALLFKKLVRRGIPPKDIELESKSTNTREQSIEVLKIAQKQKWKKIILVASNYHQYRAFLTFLKTFKENNADVTLINAPASLSWFEKNEWGRRVDLLEQEFERIRKYQKKHHVAGFEEAILYQEWKEKKLKR